MDKASEQTYDCREEFERWATKNAFSVHKGGFYPPDQYKNTNTEYVWKVWQAAWHPKRESLKRRPQVLSEPPCDQCGYNGAGYYQPEMHQWRPYQKYARASDAKKAIEALTKREGLLKEYRLKEKQ